MTGRVPAHGIGDVAGLPLDGELVLQTGGVVVLVSFLAVALGRREPRFAEPAGGRAFPPRVRAVLDAAGTRTAIRAAMLLAALTVLAWGFAGPQDPDANPAPRALYVLLWVGLVPASLLLGPVWRMANPLRLAHRGLAAVLGVPPRGRAPLPQRLGYRPAAVGLAAFVTLELAVPGREQPAVVAGFLTLYAAVHLAAALRFGPAWFDRGDAFEVYSALAGALAPVGRLADGRLGWRHPLRGLAAVAPAPGLVGVLAVWWASTVVDGVGGTPGWAAARAAAGAAVPLLDAALIAAATALVALLYRLATGRLAGPLATTLVPIAAGYTIAHYAVLLLVEGPRGLAQLGGAVLGPVTAVPAPAAVAAVQVAAILAGHVAAVLAAHDRSLALLPPHRRLADQFPLVLLMVAYTMAGLGLLVVV